MSALLEHERDHEIVVVDDDPTIVRVLSRIVSPLGHVRFALDGNELLRMVGETVPDLILLDAEMPGLSGFEVCARLKAEEATADVPVIFVTSHGDESVEQRGLEAGAADFITKPIRPAILLARVRTQLRLKTAIDGLKHMASVDPLTGLANRRSFFRTLRQEWAQAVRDAAPMSLVLLDIDHFKRFNDTYGHPAGDACLKAVAKALAAAGMRPSDMVARYGGEEFVMLLPGTGGGGAGIVVERVIEKVRTLAIPHSASPTGFVTISAGLAHCDLAVHQGATIQSEAEEYIPPRVQELLDAADQALYEAKAAGRDRFVQKEVGWTLTTRSGVLEA